MTGKYLMPEIIDYHTHVGNLKGTTTSGENYTDENVRRQLQKFQDFGVAAILSMGTEQPIGVAIRDSSKAGLIPGATFYSAIYGFGVKGAMPPESAGFTHIYRPSTPAEATAMVRQLVTLNGARLLHIDADQGSLEKGKKADFIVLDKDPLTDIHHTLSIDAVWKDGVKVSDGPLKPFAK
jgi:imidazolonepropionase-like amidohydrolase